MSHRHHQHALGQISLVVKKKDEFEQIALFGMVRHFSLAGCQVFASHESGGSSLVRDVVHSATNDRVGLGAILEKPGLLIPRDPLDSDRPPDRSPDPSSPSRRPADLWVPRGPGGGLEAWDFFVTSAFRLGPATPDPAAFAGVFSSVETRKRALLDTALQCSHAGITFCPPRH